MQEVRVRGVWTGNKQPQQTMVFEGQKIASGVGPLPKETLDLYRTPEGYKVVYHEDGGKVIYPSPTTDYTEEQVSKEFPELWQEYK